MAGTVMDAARKLLDKIFLEHPRAMGESYLQHFLFAARTGFILLYAGLAALIHGLVPALCKTTASDTVCTLSETIKRQRNGQPPTAE